MDVGHKRVTYVNWQGGQVINDWEKSSLNLLSDDNYQVWQNDIEKQQNRMYENNYVVSQ